MHRLILTALLTIGPSLAAAQTIPACALSGSMTMMIEGKPALRLSDVANCPPELYVILNSIQIDGQPMVHFKSGTSGDTDCLAKGSNTVSAEDKQASTMGDVRCQTK